MPCGRRVSLGSWQAQGSVVRRISNCVTDRFCRRARCRRGYGGGRGARVGVLVSNGPSRFHRVVPPPLAPSPFCRAPFFPPHAPPPARDPYEQLSEVLPPHAP